MTTAQAAAPAAAPAPAAAASPAAAPAAAAPAAAAPAAAPASAPAASNAQPGAASGQPGEGGDGKGGSDPGAQVPEKYEFQAPEGIELESTAVGEFEAIAKDLKLPQAEAQKLVDVAVKLQQRQIEKHAATVKGWADQCKTDKDFGGDALDQNMAVARKAIETFGSKELVELLNGSGLGNHPEVVRAFYRVGKEISEGRFIAAGGRSPTPAGKSLANVLYPDLK